MTVKIPNPMAIPVLLSPELEWFVITFTPSGVLRSDTQ